MKHTKRNITIMQRLSWSYFILVTVFLMITGIFILPAQLKSFHASLEQEISWTARLLSCNQQVIREMQLGEISPSLKEDLTKIAEESTDIDYIVLVNTDFIRLYHPDASEIGKHFVGNDGKAVLSEKTHYITTGKGRNDVQKRAFQQIQDADGNVLGFVLVSASMSTVRALQYQLIQKFLFTFTILFLLGLFFSYLTARKIRGSLLGFEPDAFTKLFIQREEILDNLNEGIIALQTNKEIRYCNPMAFSLLQGNIHLDDYPETAPLIQECIQTQTSKLGIPLEYQGHSLLFSSIPLFESDQVVGVLLLLRDRTELLHLAEQLNGTTHIINALRANTHEFLNKLHIISGMLQIGEYDAVIAYTNGLSSETRNSYQTVITQIQNKTIAALLLGKQSRAKELNIDFTIQKDSFLDEHNPFLSTQELVTIIGNLIENAFHAVKMKDDLRQIQLHISQTDEGITIMVDDTGNGLTKDQIDRIYIGHFTTRGEGHGVGLRLIQEIVKKHDGYLDIISDPGIGSSFSISIQKKVR